MPSPLVDEITAKPATWGVIVLLTGVWWFLTSRQLGYLEVGMSYERTVKQRELWRILTAQVSHIEIVHLGLNCFSLWSFGLVEKQGWGAERHGSVAYLGTSLLLLLLSGVISLAVYHVLIVYLQKEQFLNVTVVGYSAVIFGWMTLYAFSVGGSFILMGLSQFPIPMYLAPVTYLLLTQLLIRRASFVGHLSGIVSGAVVAAGAFDWLNIFLTLGLLGVSLGCAAGYLLYTGRLTLPFPNFRREPDVEIGGPSPRAPLIPSQPE